VKESFEVEQFPKNIETSKMFLWKNDIKTDFPLIR
jgi:hypothetical protein